MNLLSSEPMKYRHPILVVDDEKSILNAFKRILADEDYELETAQNGEEGLEKLRTANKPFSLIISDQCMPFMTGAQFFAKAKEICPMSVRILLTGYADSNAIIEAVNNGGIHLYLTKPWREDELLYQIKLWLAKAELVMENHRLGALIKKQNNELLELNKNLEEKVEEKTSHLIVQARELAASYQQTKKVMEGTVRAIAKMVESRDPYTAGHQEQVTTIACIIAREMALPEKQIEGIRIAASLHDMGKIAVPSEILTKPGKLSPLEMEIIKTHCRVAYDILCKIEFPYPVADIVYQHHERMNGSGYPQGLAQDGILLESRIITIADVIEAMASHRPYRPALGVDKAIAEIINNRGVLYDEEAGRACQSIYEHNKGDVFMKKSIQSR